MRTIQPEFSRRKGNGSEIFENLVAWSENAFSSLEAARFLVSNKNEDLWRTRFFLTAQSITFVFSANRICQIWWEIRESSISIRVIFWALSIRRKIPVGISNFRLTVPEWKYIEKQTEPWYVDTVTFYRLQQQGLKTNLNYSENFPKGFLNSLK